MSKDHNRFTLDDAQTAELVQMRQALDDQYQRLQALLESAFRPEYEAKPVSLAGNFVMMMAQPTGKFNTCPYCVYMLIHTLRETAEVFEDVARRLKIELKEPDFAQWKRD
jgi:hypothetical protein